MSGKNEQPAPEEAGFVSGEKPALKSVPVEKSAPAEKVKVSRVWSNPIDGEYLIKSEAEYRLVGEQSWAAIEQAGHKLESGAFNSLPKPHAWSHQKEWKTATEKFLSELETLLWRYGLVHPDSPVTSIIKTTIIKRFWNLALEASKAVLGEK